MNKLMVLVAAMAMITSFTVTVEAADAEWDFYGSARIATFYTDVSEGVDDGFYLDLQSNSRIGAHVKVNDELKGRFEYGASGGNANIRLLYGEWDFGSGKIRVGQAYSPLILGYAVQVYGGDLGLVGRGTVYSGRNPMIELRFGDFKIAAVKPTYANQDTPTIEAKYTFKFDAGEIQIAGGYDGGGNDIDESYLVGVAGKVNLGAFSLSGNIWTGEYAENLIAIKVEGEDNFGYTVVAGFKLNDTIKFEAGYGYAEGDDSDIYGYYLQAPITVAPSVWIVPEIGTDYSGDTDYIGAKWQINF